MPQGKCAFCGTFVTGAGVAMGKHSVACRECAPLANKWLEKNAPPPQADAAAPAE
jgi:recombinational DNA repair protein (RecF pathway)